MFSSDDLKSLHSFLKSTGEGNLKKMLVGAKMSEAHLRLLVKVARATKEDEFAAHIEADTFPKVKFAPAETTIKEGFWTVCTDACAKVGLLTYKKSA